MSEVDTPIREYNEKLGVSYGVDEKTERPFIRAYTEVDGCGYNNIKIDILDILDYLKEYHPQVLAAVTFGIWESNNQIIGSPKGAR